MSYQEKKQFFSGILTIYGRKAVEEALLDDKLNIYKLHLADSNRKAGIIDQCISLAEKRDVEIAWHDKRALSFISKNAQQDQGIALDIQLEGLQDISELNSAKAKHLLLLDNVTNPQNLGMIIRSATAGFVDGIIIPRKGCAELGPLVIKASAGSLFKARIYRSETTQAALKSLAADYTIVGLSLDTSNTLQQYAFEQPTVFVLGNESRGIAEQSQAFCQQMVKIPMNNQVESLNVAVTAALIAFHPDLMALKTGG